MKLRKAKAKKRLPLLSAVPVMNDSDRPSHSVRLVDELPRRVAEWPSRPQAAPTVLCLPLMHHCIPLPLSPLVPIDSLLYYVDVFSLTMAIIAKQKRATDSIKLQAQPTDGAEQGARSFQLIVH